MTSRERLLPIAFTVTLGVWACSWQNREGPDVTCADLQDGAVNACEDGIIATCTNGAVTWRVCEDDPDACDASFQEPGKFRCDDTEPVPGSGGSGASNSSGGHGGTSTGGGGTGGMPVGGGGAGGCDPSGPCVVFAGDQTVDSYIVDDSNLYVADGEALHSVPKAGGVPTVLASGLDGEAYGSIAVDAQHVYMALDGTEDRVVRVPVGGGSVETLASGSTAYRGLALDNLNYFFFESQLATKLMSGPKLGGALVTVVDSTNDGSRIVERDGFLYWQAANGVQRVSTADPLPATPSTIALGYYATDFAVGPTNVFFANTGAGVVGKFPLSGSTITELATGQTFPSHLAIDSTWVFYAPDYLGSPEIRKVNQQGGSPVLVAVGGVNIDVGSIVVDDTHVYWAAGTEVWRTPK